MAWLLVSTGMPSSASSAAISPAERMAVQLMKQASAPGCRRSCGGGARTRAAMAAGGMPAISALVSTPMRSPPTTVMPWLARKPISRSCTASM